MIWRILLVIGALTFLANGCSILSDEDCNSVDIGGQRREISVTCHRSPNAGEFSQGTAGTLGIVIGLGMITLAAWPLIQNARYNRQSNYGGSTYSSYTPPRTEQPPPKPPPTPPKPPPPPPPKTNVCSSCERRLEGHEKFCGHCGTKTT